MAPLKRIAPKLPNSSAQGTNNSAAATASSANVRRGAQTRNDANVVNLQLNTTNNTTVRQAGRGVNATNPTIVRQPPPNVRVRS